MSTLLDTPVIPGSDTCLQMQDALQAILRVGLEQRLFHMQLKKILDVVTRLEWLGAQGRGAIFITNSQGDLNLSVEHGMPESIKEMCQKVGAGSSACGVSAQETEIVHHPHVQTLDADGRTRSVPCPHFSIPLLGPDQDVLGVMVLYVHETHQPQAYEQVFLETLGAAVSNILVTQNLKMKSEINHIRYQRAQRDVTEKLVLASEYRDNETGNHIRRMSKYSRIIGKHAGLTEHQLDILESAAPMHDIGKVGIPDHIMLKPGPLDESEIGVMRTHPTIGGNLLQGDHELIQAGRDIALSHHEHWDGNGYPLGLQGIEIPLYGRICAIADVYDALTSSRPYKEAWPREKALDLIDSLAGTQFDPDLVKAFMKGLWEILAVQARYSDEGHEAKFELPSDTPEIADPLITWTDDLLVNNELIDKQHRFLVHRVNLVHQAIKEQDTKAIMEALRDARAYAGIHFRAEEELMESKGYPELSRHRRLHEIFSDKLDQFEEDMRDHPLATTGDLILYMRDWVVKHILVVDAEYADYIKRDADKNGLFD